MYIQYILVVAYSAFVKLVPYLHVRVSLGTKFKTLVRASPLRFASCVHLNICIKSVTSTLLEVNRCDKQQGLATALT